MPIHVNGFDVTPLNSRAARNVLWRHVAALDTEIVIPAGVSVITIFNTEPTPLLFAKGTTPNPEATQLDGDVTSAGLLIEAGKAAVMLVTVIPAQKIKFKAVAEAATGGATEATMAQLLATYKAEDAPSATGDLGLPLLAVRQLADTPSSDADGDYTWLKMDEEGRLKVATKPASIVAVTGNATAVGNTIVCDVRRASNIAFHVKNTGSVTLAAGTFVFEASIDSTDGIDGTWFGIQAVRTNANTIETQIALSGMTAGTGYASGWETSVNGYAWVRLRCTVAVTASAIATWTIQRGSYATEPVPAIQLTASQPVAATAVASVVRMGFVAGAGIWYDDSSTNLAASATFTGTSRDATLTATATAFANAATYAQEVRVIAESDVTGTLWLEISRDGTNWRRIRSVATAAITGGGFAAEIIYRPAWKYWRAGYTNGAGAQARFALGTLAMAA